MTVLQLAISTSEVIDEWKLFQVDNELPDYNQQERIEVLECSFPITV